MAEKRKLLIIDDDPDFVDGIKSILQAGDYEVDAAYNPKDGSTRSRASTTIACCSTS